MNSDDDNDFFPFLISYLAGIVVGILIGFVFWGLAPACPVLPY